MPTEPGQPTRIAVGLRYRDLDTVGHVNQAVYHSFLEQGRAALLVELMGTERVDVVLAHVELDHRREIRLADREVVVETRVEQVGTSSLRTGMRILLPDGGVAAEGHAVLVAWDGEARAARPWSDREREAFTAALVPA